MSSRAYWRVLLAFWAGAALAVVGSGCAGPATGPDSESRAASAAQELVILHTNDLHGHIAPSADSAGAARIAAWIAAQRQAHEQVLVLDAGDAISGTPVSTLFSGVPIFQVMNAMGYDLGLIGNHEFDHGWSQIQKFRDTADFPLLGANAHTPAGELLADLPWVIWQRGALRVAVIGVITPTTPQIITPIGNAGLVISDPVSVLKPLVARLHNEADLIVVLSHVGHQGERLLAAQLPDIDVIVGGHSHTRLEQPVRVGNTLVAQAHEYGKAVGYLHLRVDRAADEVTLLAGGLVPAAELPAGEPSVAALVEEWEQQVAAQVDFQIAESDRLIMPAELRNWMEIVLRKHTGADLAYYNSGGVRDAIRAGPVSARHIWNIEPFGNTVVTLSLNGAQVVRMLALNGDDAGVVLEPERRYRVATNSFIGAHAARAFGDSVQLQDTGVLVRDVLIDAVRRDGLP